MEKRIIEFIKKHHLLTLATAADNQPYCANAFYAYDPLRNIFIFTTDSTTRHGKEMSLNTSIAASIAWETKLVGRVQGLQLTGTITKADQNARQCYIGRFPYAAAADLTLWSIVPNFIKYTDNTLGFGKKLIWSAE